MNITLQAIVSRRGFLDMQVCVPKEWSDDQVLDFAENENPCGTQNGWSIRRQGSEFLSGSDERVQCADERVQCADHKDKCHIMLDA